MSAQEAPVVLVDASTKRQQSISRIVRMLMADAEMRHDNQLAEALHVNTSKMSRLFSGKWEIEHLDLLAMVFDVPVTMFFMDADDAKRALAEGAQKRKKNSSPDLRILRNDAARTTGDRAMLMLASDAPSDPI